MTRNLSNTLLYFPTTVLLVDDDKGFLSNVSLNLAKISTLLFDDPEAALELINKTNCIDSLLDRLNKVISQNENIYKSYTETISAKLPLFSEIYNTDRFKYISVAIVDYSMPKINGKQFFEKLRKNPIRKIMLTGAADYKMAVDMFNDGLIDKFIVKDSSDMISDLKEAIEESQIKYFLNISEQIEKSNSQIARIQPINNDVEKFITNYFIDHKFFECYTLDWNGSSIFLDMNGSPQWIIIKSVKEIDAYLDIAKDHEAPMDIIKSLSSREKIPFFLTELDEKVPVESWGKYLHPAKHLSNDYYYSCLSDSSVYPLDNIFSYQKYLETL